MIVDSENPIYQNIFPVHPRMLYAAFLETIPKTSSFSIRKTIWSTYKVCLIYWGTSLAADSISTYILYKQRTAAATEFNEYYKINVRQGKKYNQIFFCSFTPHLNDRRRMTITATSPGNWFLKTPLKIRFKWWIFMTTGTCNKKTRISRFPSWHNFTDRTSPLFSFLRSRYCPTPAG